MKTRYLFAIVFPTLITAFSILWYRKRKKIKANLNQTLPKQEIMNSQSEEPLQSEEVPLDLNDSECLNNLTISETSHLNSIPPQNNLSSPSLEIVRPAKIQESIDGTLNLVTEDATDNQKILLEPIVIKEREILNEGSQPQNLIVPPLEEEPSQKQDLIVPPLEGEPSQQKNIIVQPLDQEPSQPQNLIAPPLEEELSQPQNPSVPSFEEEPSQPQNLIVQPLEEEPSQLQNPIVQPLEQEPSQPQNPIVQPLEQEPSQPQNLCVPPLEEKSLHPQDLIVTPLEEEPVTANEEDEILVSDIPEEIFEENIQNENQIPLNSDIRSVGSNDSGKGGSDIVYTTELIQASKKLVFEFEIPQELCGRLIGRNGKHINYLKNQSNTLINIKKHPFSPLLNICSIEGTESDVQMALDLIRNKFPLPQFPVLTMDQVNANALPSPESLKLQLPEGMTCDVILSSLVTAGHFFLQQPTHPTHANLCRLDQLMLSCYSNTGTPLLPRPVEPGIICAAPIMDGWYRAEVICSYESTNECEIKFLDYGGFSRLPTSSLRQIWSDFMTVPFQATECLLANVTPKSETHEWSVEACMFFEELAQGQILQAVIAGFSEEGLPYVHLHRVQGATTIYINKELVLRDYANWVEKPY